MTTTQRFLKNRLVVVLLCFFLGALGIHRFYMGHMLVGIIQLLTGGGFGIWFLIDFVRLLLGGFKNDVNPW